LALIVGSAQQENLMLKCRS